MIDRFQPRRSEFADGPMRDEDPMLSGSAEMGLNAMLYGLLVLRCKPGHKYRVLSGKGDVRICTPRMSMPAVEIVVDTADVPDLIDELQKTTGAANAKPPDAVGPDTDSDNPGLDTDPGEPAEPRGPRP